MRLVAGLVAASHPVPTAVVTLLALVLTAGVGASGPTLALVGVAVLTGQLSVGLSNDWLDAPRDRSAGRADKPVATGAVPVGAVRTAALAAAAVCAVASWATGPAAGTAHVVAVASAWGYNLGLKRTAASWVPYAVSFGLLPAFGLLAAGSAVPAALVLTGALLGTGAHVANVLPDLEDDDATGVRGLPHRLGRRASSVLAPILLAAGVGVVVAGLPGRSAPVLAAAALAGMLAATAGLVAVRRPASRAPFLLSMVVAALAVLLLVTSGGRLS